MKEFPTNEWISANQTYTNARHDLILYHCVGPVESDVEGYSNFKFDKIINIDYTQSEKAFGNIKKCVKYISVENRTMNYGNTKPSNYKIHEWKSYYDEALHGILYAVFNKLVVE